MPWLIIALVIVAAAGAADRWRQMRRPVYVAATTTCPIVGTARVVISSDVDARLLPGIRAHEDVHVAQCAALGPMKYWLTNLRSGGKLALEAPAYCAAARQRLSVDPDTEYQSDRVHEDMIATFSTIDSADVKSALRAACYDIASKPRRTRSPARARAPR